jgi:ferredoxin
MSLRYFTSAITLELDEARCIGCGMCVEVCPHGVFGMSDGPKARARIVDRDRCMECGACARNCPTEAIAASSGVGCAAALIMGKLRGTAPECGCSSNAASCCSESSSAKKKSADKGCCG